MMHPLRGSEFGGSEDRKQETNEITTWKLTLDGMCLGEGTLQAYVRGVDLDRLGLEEESDAPFVPEH